MPLLTFMTSHNVFPLNSTPLSSNVSHGLRETFLFFKPLKASHEIPTHSIRMLVKHFIVLGPASW